jgi:hypothetical protein
MQLISVSIEMVVALPWKKGTDGTASMIREKVYGTINKSGLPLVCLA